MSADGLPSVRQARPMDRKVLSFIALAVSMLYGVAVALGGDNRQTIAIIGAVVVALAWIAVGTFGKTDQT